MYYSDRVTLIGKITKLDADGVPALDDIGNPKFEEDPAEVWADVTSPSRAEVAAAGTMGLKAAAVVKVHATDYTGQTAVEIGGDRLTVYRTFRKGENVELYVTEKGGEANGH